MTDPFPLMERVIKAAREWSDQVNLPNRIRTGSYPWLTVNEALRALDEARKA